MVFNTTFNKYRYDIAEILLKVALNIIILTLTPISVISWRSVLPYDRDHDTPCNC